MENNSRSGFFDVYPMLLSFFHADGSLNLATIARRADALVRHGAHGCAVMGLGTKVNKLSGGAWRLRRFITASGLT